MPGRSSPRAKSVKTYPGIASGSTSAHSIQRRPGCGDGLRQEPGELVERVGSEYEREREADQRAGHQEGAGDGRPQSHPTWSISSSASPSSGPAPSTSMGSCPKSPNCSISDDGCAPSTAGNS